MPLSDHDRDLLLAYLYEALDADERAALEARLAAEPELRAALDGARAERALLGSAASLPADDVKIEAPQGESRRRGRLFTAFGLRAAAGILVAIAAGSIGWREFAHAAIESRHPVLSVSGPAAFAPGTPVRYDVRVADLGGDALRGKVIAELATAAGERVGDPVEVATDTDGRAQVEFAPQGRPGESYGVLFRLAAAGDAEGAGVFTPLRDASRVVTRVGTDKPVYRPGDPLRVRGVALEALRLTPAGDVPLRVRLYDPRGAVAFDETLPAVSGVGAWQHELPDDAAGGTWRVEVSGAEGEEGLVSPASVDVQVRSYRVPRLTFDVETDRDSYAPGDRGTVWARVARVEGGTPDGARVEAVLHVDGAEAQRETLVVGRDGALAVPFELPRRMREGVVRLALTVDDRGTVEGRSESIPVTLDRLRVELFPEGGDLVAGLPNRVYFRATTPAGEPAELRGELRDGSGRAVTQFASDVRGMGVFEFTPQAGASYTVAAPSLAGVSVEQEFPAITQHGVLVRALDESVAAGAPVRVRLTATDGGERVVGAWLRGVPVATARVSLRAGEPQDVALVPTTDAGGVLRVTVLDADGTPRAERLVARAAPERLDVTTTLARQRYAPRESVHVDVRVADGHGAAAQAILGASVVDAGVLALADADDVPLPLHFLLATDVERLEEAQLYAAGPGAAHATDLLLGVQGWRRFAWRDAAAFVAEHPESGPRVVAVSASDLPVQISNADEARQAAGWELRRANERSLASGVLGCIALLLLGSVVVGFRAVWQHRPLAALGGFALPVLALVAVVLVRSGTMEMAAVEKAMPAAAMAPGGEWLGAEDEVALMDAIEAKPEAKEMRHDLDGEVAQAEARLRIAELAEELDDDFEEEVAADEKFAGFLDEIGERKGVGKKRAQLRPRERVLARVFAHRAAAWQGVRDDFAEVLYWHPLLVTDAEGRASFEFDTSDAVTRFRIAIDAHDARGALGAGGTSIECRLPLAAEPKLPVEVAAGDEIDLPVSVVNDGADAARVQLTLDIEGDLLAPRGAGGLPSTDLQLAAGERARAVLPLVARQGAGTARLRLRADAGAGRSDVSVREIGVAPRGYPRTVARSGSVSGAVDLHVTLPDAYDVASLRGGLRVYPSTLATLVDGLDGLLAQPGGCFEQASSNNYPNVLVMNYLQEQQVAEPAVAARAKDLLGKGYALLTGYECRARGFEWFGADPGHEALTAYGLMEFTDMARVFDVDPKLVERTRTWLLDRRDGDGGFRLQDRQLDTFGGAGKELTNAYVVWALTESDPEHGLDITKELARLETRARESDDPYVVALAANALLNRDLPGGDALLEKLAGMQQEDGRLDGKTTSITSSSGPNLTVETTSLAALAFSRRPARLANAESAVRYILGQRQGGRFGATQATILALRALTAHARAARTTASDHDLEVSVGGRVVATRHVPAGTPGVIEFGPEVLGALASGANDITLRSTGDEALPFGLALSYHTQLPADDAACPVTVTTALSADDVAEGASVGLTATVTNTSEKPVAMTLARIGYPAGLEPRTARLDELKRAGVIDFYELRPREITLYWRALAPRETKRVETDLLAAIPGRYEGPASSVYLYYGDDAKRWTEPLRVRIAAR